MHGSKPAVLRRIQKKTRTNDNGLPCNRKNIHTGLHDSVESDMKYNPAAHHRKSIRLRGYDYSQAGAYFVTVCIQNRECLFGDIVDGEMVLNDAGCFVQNVWNDLPNHYPHVELDHFIIMPNHFHGIVVITDHIDKSSHRGGAIHDVGAIHELPLHHELPLQNRKQRRNMTLPKLIGRFKMVTAKYINRLHRTSGIKLWQRNYYEHIVRNDDDLGRIRQYITDNPLKWTTDKENPSNQEKETCLQRNN